MLHKKYTNFGERSLIETTNLVDWEKSGIFVEDSQYIALYPWVKVLTIDSVT